MKFSRLDETKSGRRWGKGGSLDHVEPHGHLKPLSLLLQKVNQRGRELEEASSSELRLYQDACGDAERFGKFDSGYSRPQRGWGRALQRFCKQDNETVANSPTSLPRQTIFRGFADLKPIRQGMFERVRCGFMGKAGTDPGMVLSVETGFACGRRKNQHVLVAWRFCPCPTGFARVCLIGIWRFQGASLHSLVQQRLSLFPPDSRQAKLSTGSHSLHLRRTRGSRSVW